MLQKIDELKEPPIIGKYYLVPCIYKSEEIIEGSNILHLYDNNGSYYIQKSKKIIDEKFIPIINFPHNDKQTGQKEYHYHLDTRFILHNHNFPIRINKEVNQDLRYISLKCYSQINTYSTHNSLIKNIKLYQKCISSKNKCPHKKYDLSQIVPIDGVITCPLHSLKFNSITKQLIE